MVYYVFYDNRIVQSLKIAPYLIGLSLKFQGVWKRAVLQIVHILYPSVVHAACAYHIFFK